MASKGYMPIVHVLNDGDVALGARRRWWWPFFKQTKYLLQLIAINRIPVKVVLAGTRFFDRQQPKKGTLYVYGRNSTKSTLRKPAPVVDDRRRRRP